MAEFDNGSLTTASFIVREVFFIIFKPCSFEGPKNLVYKLPFINPHPLKSLKQLSKLHFSERKHLLTINYFVYCQADLLKQNEKIFTFFTCYILLLYPFFAGSIQ